MGQRSGWSLMTDDFAGMLCLARSLLKRWEQRFWIVLTCLDPGDGPHAVVADFSQWLV